MDGNVAARTGMKRRRLFSYTMALALAAPMAIASGGAVAAQDDAKFCSDTNIVFFPGGPEGGAFSTVVYNGAKAAQALFGANVDYQFSNWDVNLMLTQFQEAVATGPDGIAVMGHPGDASFKPLIDDAVAQGIIVTVMNTELQETQAAYASQGTGYAGATLLKAGSDLGKETVKRAGLVPGDKVFVWGLLAEAGRGLRTQGIIDGLMEAGIAEDDIIYLEIDTATNGDPSVGIPTFTGMASANPDLKAAIFDHGEMTAIARTYLESAGLGPDDLYVSGFDLAPSTVEAIRSDYTDLVIDQQQWLQGFEGIAQLCLSHNYGFSGLTINTGGGFADKDNVEALAELVSQQIR